MFGQMLNNTHVVYKIMEVFIFFLPPLEVSVCLSFYTSLTNEFRLRLLVSVFYKSHTQLTSVGNYIMRNALQCLSLNPATTV